MQLKLWLQNKIYQLSHYQPHPITPSRAEQSSTSKVDIVASNIVLFHDTLARGKRAHWSCRAQAIWMLGSWSRAEMGRWDMVAAGHQTLDT